MKKEKTNGFNEPFFYFTSPHFLQPNSSSFNIGTNSSLSNPETDCQSNLCKKQLLNENIKDNFSDSSSDEDNDSSQRNEAPLIEISPPQHKPQLFEVEKTQKGKYNIKSSEFKLKCLKDLETMTPNQVAKRYKVSLRNIHRWKVKGANRKKGSGRLFKDPFLYLKVYYWYLHQPIGTVTGKTLLAMAKELSTDQSFQASHGWLCKFKAYYKNQILLK